MEIGRIQRGNALTQEVKVSGNKKDFSQSFNQARDRRSQEQLKQLIDDIKKKGNTSKTRMPFFVFIILGEYYEEYIKYCRQFKNIYTIFLKKIKIKRAVPFLIKKSF